MSVQPSDRLCSAMSLQRKLNLFDATMLVVGNVVGAGIFTTAGFLAGELPNPIFFLAVWLVGGVLTICGALTYAEMSGMFPRSGGDYLFLNAAYGPWAGFLLGWICFWVINPGSIAVLAIAIAKYLKGFVDFGAGGEKLTALGIVVFLSSLNYRGVRLTGTTHNVWTLASLSIMILLICGGLASGRGEWAHLHQSAQSTIKPLKILGPAMIAVIFSYSGWFVSAYIGEEVKRPERNLPLSLILGTSIVTALYMLLNVIYLYAVPVNDLAGIVNVGQTVATRLLPPGLAGLISVAIILAIGASINATILSGARLTYAMAKDSLLWPALGRVHEKNGVPHVALICQSALAGVFILAETFENLLNSVVFVMLLSSIGSGLAHIILRRRMPATQRPYKTIGYPFVPVLFIATYLWIASQIAISSPVRSLVGVIITLSGLPLYFWVFSGRRSLDPAL
jgi:basic amino acid/polyamine antiporter, APA family